MFTELKHSNGDNKIALVDMLTKAIMHYNYIEFRGYILDPNCVTLYIRSPHLEYVVFEAQVPGIFLHSVA